MSQRPKPIQQARSLRKNTVPAEALLWKALRNRALGGFKFRRQHPIGPYFVDFACVECAIVVEADGESHLEKRRVGSERTRGIQSAGCHGLLFSNTESYDDLKAVK